MDRSEEGVVERPSGRTADPRPSVAQGVAETPTPRAGGVGGGAGVTGQDVT